MVVGLHHVAVIVKNVENAAQFYRDVFEFVDKKRLTASVSQHRGAWFQLGQLELHLQERAETDTPKSEQHFALLTEKFDELVQRTRLHGGRVEEAKLIEGISRRCFLYDPDENRIELLQK